MYMYFKNVLGCLTSAGRQFQTLVKGSFHSGKLSVDKKIFENRN
jgi:hypothetical protein